MSFSFPYQVLGQHLAIVGKSGSGKTYTSKGMVERLLAHERRVCHGGSAVHDAHVDSVHDQDRWDTSRRFYLHGVRGAERCGDAVQSRGHYLAGDHPRSVGNDHVLSGDADRDRHRAGEREIYRIVQGLSSQPGCADRGDGEMSDPSRAARDALLASRRYVLAAIPSDSKSQRNEASNTLTVVDSALDRLALAAGSAEPDHPALIANREVAMMLLRNDQEGAVKWAKDLHLEAGGLCTALGAATVMPAAPSESLFRRLLAWDQMNPPMTGDHAYWKREIESALAALRPTAPRPVTADALIAELVRIGEGYTAKNAAKALAALSPPGGHQ